MSENHKHDHAPIRHKKYLAIHNHTREGSMRDAILSVDDLYKYCDTNGVSATITDHGTIASFVKAMNLAKNYPNVKMVYGCEFYTNYNRDRIEQIKKEIAIAEEMGDLAAAKVLNEELEDIRKYNHLVVIAKNQHGLHNLIELHNEGYKHFYEKPIITHKDLFSLERDKKGDLGLVVTSACLAGVIPQNILKGHTNVAYEFAGEFREHLKENYFLEVQVNKLNDQKLVNEEILRIHSKLKIPMIVSTDAHYLDESYNRAHEIFLLIQGKQKVSDIGKQVMRVSMRNKAGKLIRKKFDPDDQTKKFMGINPSDLKIGDQFDKNGLVTDEVKYDKRGNPKKKLTVQYTIEKIEQVSKVWTIESNLVLRDQDDMKKAVDDYDHSELKDVIDTCIETNMQVYDLIEDGIDINRDIKLPEIPNASAILKKICAENIVTMQIADKAHIDRLKYELSIILEADFASYFLILKDVIDFAKANGIPVGPGRGSSVGSLVVYLLGITRLDPLDPRYSYPFEFERFLDLNRAGINKIVVIKDENGNEYRFNPNQEVETKNGKKKASELKEEDEIVLS